MFNSKAFSSLTLICSIFFSNITIAANPIIKIFVNNPQNIPFTFTSQNKYGNTCISQSSNNVVCTITTLTPPTPFLLSLQWNKTSNPADCGVDITLFAGSGNIFYFSFDGTYNGSFVPQTWDGKSNINATLTISSPRYSGC